MTSLLLLEKQLLIGVYASHLHRTLISLLLNSWKKQFIYHFDRVESLDYASTTILSEACKIAENIIN